jgi:hypothetical protein
MKEKNRIKNFISISILIFFFFQQLSFLFLPYSLDEKKQTNNVVFAELKLPEIKYPELPGGIEPPQSFIFKIKCADDPGDLFDKNDEFNPNAKSPCKNLIGPNGLFPTTVKKTEFQTKLQNAGYTKDNLFRYYVIYFLNLLTIIAVIICFGAFIYGGVLYLISTGKPAMLKEGKDWMQAALAGLIIVIASYAILYTINPQLTFFLKRKVSKLSPSVNPSKGSGEEVMRSVPTGYLIERTLNKIQIINTFGKDVEKTIDDIQRETNNLIKALERMNIDIKSDICACGSANCLGNKPNPEKPCNPPYEDECKKLIEEDQKRIEDIIKNLEFYQKKLILLEIPIIIDYLDLKVAALFMSNAENLADYGYFSYYQQAANQKITAQSILQFKDVSKTTSTPLAIESGSVYKIIQIVKNTCNKNVDSANYKLLCDESENSTSIMSIAFNIYNEGNNQWKPKLDETLKKLNYWYSLANSTSSFAKECINPQGGLTILKDFVATATSTINFLREKTFQIREAEDKVSPKYRTFKIYLELSKIATLVDYFENKINIIRKEIDVEDPQIHTNLLRECTNIRTSSNNQQANQALTKALQILDRIFFQLYYISLYADAIFAAPYAKPDYATFYFNSEDLTNKDLMNKAKEYNILSVLSKKPYTKLEERYKSAIQSALGTPYLDLTDEEWREVINTANLLLQKDEVLINTIANVYARLATQNAIQQLIDKLKDLVPSSYQNNQKTKIFSLKQNIALAQEANGDYLFEYIAQQFNLFLQKFIQEDLKNILMDLGMSALSQALKELGNYYPGFNPNYWQSISQDLQNILDARWVDIIPHLQEALESKMEEILPSVMTDYLNEVSNAIENAMDQISQKITSWILISIENIFDALLSMVKDTGKIGEMLLPYLEVLKDAALSYLDIYISENVEAFLESYLSEVMISPISISIEIGEFLNTKLKDILPEQWVKDLNYSLKETLENCQAKICLETLNLFSNAISTTQAIADGINNVINQIDDTISTTPSTLAGIIAPGLYQYWDKKTIYQIITECPDQNNTKDVRCIFKNAIEKTPKDYLCDTIINNNWCGDNTCDCFEKTPLAALSKYTTSSIIELTGGEMPTSSSILRAAGTIRIQFTIDNTSCDCQISLYDLFNTSIQNLENQVSCKSNSNLCKPNAIDNWLKEHSLLDLILNNNPNLDPTTTQYIKDFFEKPISQYISDFASTSDGKKIIAFFTTPFLSWPAFDDSETGIQVSNILKTSTFFDLFSDQGKTPFENLLPQDLRTLKQLIFQYDKTFTQTFPGAVDFLNSWEKPWKELFLTWSCHILPENCQWFQLLDKKIVWDLLFTFFYFSGDSPTKGNFASSTEKAEETYRWLSRESIASLLGIGGLDKTLAGFIPLKVICKNREYTTLDSLFNAKISDILKDCIDEKLDYQYLKNNDNNYQNSTIIQLLDNKVIDGPYNFHYFDYFLNTSIRDLFPIFLVSNNVTSSLKKIEEAPFLCKKFDSASDDYQKYKYHICALAYYSSNETDDAKKQKAIDYQKGCDLVYFLDDILNKSIYQNIIRNSANTQDIFENPLKYWIEKKPPFSSTIKEILPDKVCATTSKSIAKALNFENNCSPTSDENKLYCCIPLKEPLDAFFNFNLKEWIKGVVHDTFTTYFEEHPEQLWNNVKENVEEELEKSVYEAISQVLGEKVVSTSTLEAISNAMTSTTEEILKETIPSLLENGIYLNDLENL